MPDKVLNTLVPAIPWLWCTLKSLTPKKKPWAGNMLSSNSLAKRNWSWLMVLTEISYSLTSMTQLLFISFSHYAHFGLHFLFFRATIISWNWLANRFCSCTFQYTLTLPIITTLIYWIRQPVGRSYHSLWDFERGWLHGYIWWFIHIRNYDLCYNYISHSWQK